MNTIPDGGGDPSGPVGRPPTNDEKVVKRITYLVGGLFTSARIAPRPFRPGTTAPRDSLARELRVPNTGSLEFTDVGFRDFQQLVADLEVLKLCGGLVAYSDVWTATRNVVEENVAKGLAPENAEELIAEVRARLVPMIASHRYVVPLYGVILKGRDTAQLGAYQLLTPSPDNLARLGLDPSVAHVAPVLDQMGTHSWLTGMASGTPTVAFERFRYHAELLVGLLAVFTAADFEGGATGFRFHLGLSAETSRGHGVYLSWPETDPSRVAVHFNSHRSQELELSPDMEAQFCEAGIFAAAMAFLESTTRTPLQESLLRAIYWFADAQRDPVSLMQFIKYWSCVESIFSREGAVVRSVATGLATVLVVGSYRYFPAAEYRALKKRITALYVARCRALHAGSHLHVTETQVAELSQWTAWMVINVVHLTMQGYATPESVSEQTDRLDGVFLRAVAAKSPVPPRGP